MHINDINIEGRKIGLHQKPFIIAELSGNHNQSLDTALQLVKAAAKAGADAIKLQTYTADTMTLNVKNKDFYISDEQSLWKKEYLYDLYKKSHTPWEWHEELFKKARQLDLVPFSSAFDKTAVDFLETLDVPCYKIASFELVDLKLIEYIASKKKPIIISSGMASISDINNAITTIRNFGINDIVLLKCTSAYPAQAKDANLTTIPNMKDTFQCHVGLSDHTLGTAVATTSVALGARVIEKHFTISRKNGGVDSSFSLEPQELKELVENTKIAYDSLGTICYGSNKSEEKSKIFRRSLYVVKDVQKGEKLTEENVKSIRPGLGLNVKYHDIIMGRTFNKSVSKGTALTWDII